MQGADLLKTPVAPVPAARFRSTARDLALRGLEASGGFRRARRSIAARKDIVVLTLHRIVPDSERSVCRSPRGMVLKESMFVKLLEYLKATATLVSLGEPIVDASTLSRPHVLITFDDGWVDNREVALPHLARANVRAHFFAVTEFIGRERPFWPERVLSLLEMAGKTGQLGIINDMLKSLHHDNDKACPFVNASEHYEEMLRWLKQFPSAVIFQWLEKARERLCLMSLRLSDFSAPDPRERLMTWEQLQVLIDAGHGVGSHTCTHAILPQLDRDQLGQELCASRLALQEHLRLPSREPLWISYPDGAASSSIARASRDAQYQGGFLNNAGLWQGRTNPFLVPRVNVWDGTLMNSNGVFCERQLEYALFWKAHNAAVQA